MLDVAGGLPEVIVATTAGTSTYYVQIRDQVLAQQDSGAWVYILPDHLGSVRQLVGSDSQVALAQSFDPFGGSFESAGSGSSEFGYTGEWWDAEAALLYLRARYYEPVVGRFIGKDPWLGDPLQPHTLNGYSYVGSNSVNRQDPSGLNGEPDIPDQAQWTLAGGLSWEHSFLALQRLVSLRGYVIAAAQRHGFVPQRICAASRAQGQLMYSLAAIVYRESLGYDEEGPLQAWAALFGAKVSIGIVQIRPDTTAREIEEAGLLYDPGTVDNPSTIATPYDEQQGFGDQVVQLLGGDPQREARINRLLDPMWAVEYAAGNMERARSQSDWHSNPQHPTLSRTMTEWEKMAAWYNTGIIDAERVRLEEREEFKTKVLDPYLWGTYKAMTAIENLDLLGVKSECDGSCDPLPAILKD